jgi:hypothetical protein
MVEFVGHALLNSTIALQIYQMFWHMLLFKILVTQLINISLTLWHQNEVYCVLCEKHEI